MGFLSNLFKKKEQPVLEVEGIGMMKGCFIKGEVSYWEGKTILAGKEVELFLDGDATGPDERCLATIRDVLNREEHYLKECEIALREQYDNAEQEFVSTEEHFDISSVSIGDEFEITFVEKEIVYYFNVMFHDDKQKGVSIDG